MLISMAVFDTHENQRTDLTRRALASLERTVNWDRHRLIVVDNGSCGDTHKVYKSFDFPFEAIYNGKNLGTAKAINKAWRKREPGEHCVKMDNDVVIHQQGWADWMTDVFDRDSEIGICGLKRKDLEENPWTDTEWLRSKVYMLPHKPGQRWLIVEEVSHVIGTCQAYSSALLNKIGYLNQPGLYGYDDALGSVRAEVAGFKRVFLHGFEIDHLWTGLEEYTNWKRKQAGIHGGEYQELRRQYQSGETPIYCEA